MTVLSGKSLLVGIASALIALLALAACGGDDDDDNSGDDGGTTATATRTAESTDDSGNDTETPTKGSGDNGGGDNGGDPTSNVCALLTTDEVEAALGSPSADGEATSTDPYFSCAWQTEDSKNVLVQLYAGSDDDLESVYSSTSDPEEIQGMGIKAQYTDLIGLEVLTDHYVVSVSVYDFGLDTAAKRDLTLGLGDRVLNRLND